MPNPLDTALDLLVYVPIGLAITAAEELPKLAAKGRARVGTQMSMARVVGQFAVAEGRKQIERRWGQMAAPSSMSGPAPGPDPDIDYDDLVGSNGQSTASSPASASASSPASPSSASSPASASSASSASSPASASSASSPAEPAPAARPAGEDVPRSAELAIPGYDSLSASQVVQRLAGLSEEELAAVGAYEQAHRARRTILNRVSQLQGH